MHIVQIPRLIIKSYLVVPKQHTSSNIRTLANLAPRNFSRLVCINVFGIYTVLLFKKFPPHNHIAYLAFLCANDLTNSASFVLLLIKLFAL